MGRPAVEVSPTTDLWRLVLGAVPDGGFVVADEAQFYAPEQVDALARCVDERDHGERRGHHLDQVGQRLRHGSAQPLGDHEQREDPQPPCGEPASARARQGPHARALDRSAEGLER